jgi:hypothetical protein
MTKTVRLTVAASLLALMFAATPVRAATTYTYPELVQRVTDLERLAELPPPGESTALASSYDRRRSYDAVHDKYVAWTVNSDGNGVVRNEGTLAVLADLKGPGCLTRLWAAQALEGHVKIYLDDARTPAVDLPFRAYFDGSAKPFNRPELVYKTTTGKQPGGLNNFTPIPFLKSCRVVADPGWGMYYQIDYATFAPGTIVPTFQRDLAPADLAALDHANTILARRGANPDGPQPGGKTDRATVQAAPGATTLVSSLAGPQAITALRVKFDVPTDAGAAIDRLRQLAVQITWDDDKSPSVWSPLGDFFAELGGGQPFQSLPVGLAEDGTFYCYWYMPFASHAKIEIINDGPSSIAMTWEISHAPLTRPIGRFARFHAKWHRDAFLPTRPERSDEWTILTTKGRGRFVGTQFQVWNPRGGWWGEGNDMFYIDGEKFPSLLGTGSEDYFGAAWGLSPFDRALHGVVDVDPTNAHWVIHRWHIPDAVPFQTSFEGTIEKRYTNDRPTLYDGVAFWYLDPTGTDPYQPVPITDRLGYYIRPPVRHEPGAIEAESLTILKQEPNGSARAAFAAAWALPIGAVSNDQFLGWHPAALGQKLHLGLHVPNSGYYQILASFLGRATGGTFQLKLDGKALGAPVDLYGVPEPGKPVWLLLPPQDLGPVKLTAGDHVLSAEWVSTNAAETETPSGTDATPGDFGLDYVKLVEVDKGGGK